MNEIARFENSVDFLMEGLEGRMNAELKQIESALEELKDADQRVQREIQVLKNSDFEDNLNRVNNVLEEFVAYRDNNRQPRTQLTEYNIVQYLAEKSGSVLDLVEEMIDEIESIENDEETQLTEDTEAYQTIENNLQDAINEHRAILILKKDLKKAKQKQEFEQYLREELNEINYDFDDIEQLIQKVHQIQEESYEILEEVDKVLRDYANNLETLEAEMQDISDVLEGGKMPTLTMAKKLRDLCEEENLRNGQKLAGELVKRIQKLDKYVNAVNDLGKKISRGINSIESDLDSYKDQYKAEERIM